MVQQGRPHPLRDPYLKARSSMKSSTPRDAVRLSPNAITVLEKRYLLKDETGAPIETPRDLFWRVARTVAEADKRYGASEAQLTEVAQNFFGLMAERLIKKKNNKK